ncbi:amino acid ABC transporter ATP-binding protein [Ancylobacter defluvii]|uniref:Amino acid ABC transporter ATP-binding protein n=1 Tax=Ancylobacter defluvii TaxID=1282440 RepID=A0A9W6JZL9_9HYPH|nr:amino acid ABC transporter ATP-binding protein [Ancylobacter defluvii]MBS7589217.1 amino acid ABC transporter ATP-binding protein [Ancylobacter defluvii]GLK84829.1 amino acid ABC transporter ATP-binding protein [Ancylobacter defluvii]
MIRLADIEKSFDGQKVLKRVSLAVREGSVTALIGPSGSGKSTLLRCVNLLEIPEAGELVIGEAAVRFTGRALDREAVRRIRRQTGMMFQNFQLFPHRTALGNVMESLVVVLKWPEDKARARALELLEKVGLAHKVDAWPAQLSGGQQQRVAIARALASSPSVLLCDEPTSALDPELSLEVVEVLAQLAREGTTMLIATHDLRLAARVAQDAMLLDAGEVVESGPAAQLFACPRHERTARFIATLGHPVIAV